MWLLRSRLVLGSWLALLASVAALAGCDRRSTPAPQPETAPPTTTPSPAPPEAMPPASAASP